jgi:hypothetical protein
MDSNIFNLLDDDAEVPRTIQQKIRDVSFKSEEKFEKSEIKSKAIVGKKNKEIRRGRDSKSRSDAKLSKRQKKESLRSKSKSIY